MVVVVVVVMVVVMAAVVVVVVVVVVVMAVMVVASTAREAEIAPRSGGRERGSCRTFQSLSNKPPNDKTLANSFDE